jgi:hypothetical protein
MLTLVLLHALEISSDSSSLYQVSVFDVVLEVRQVGDGAFTLSKVVAKSQSSCLKLTSIAYPVVREDRPLCGEHFIIDWTFSVALEFNTTLGL